MADVGAFGAAIMAPWGLKFLWSPFVDLIRIQRFGPSHFWIVSTQTMMAVTLAFLFWLDPDEDFVLLVTLMTIHNVFASAQDVAIDGLAVRVLPDSELSWANGLMFSAQAIGMAVGGGGSLLLAARFGFSAAFALVLGGLVCLLLTVSVRLREPEGAPLSGERTVSVLTAIGRRLKMFFADLYIGFLRSGRGPLVGVAFAILPSGAVALAYGLFASLQVDLGFTETRIAVVTAISLLAAGLGCASSGFWANRYGAKRMLGIALRIDDSTDVLLGVLVR
jgi:PAT family beta-lactamase induction signal transducer AmpG